MISMQEKIDVLQDRIREYEDGYGGDVRNFEVEEVDDVEFGGDDDDDGWVRGFMEELKARTGKGLSECLAVFILGSLGGGAGNRVCVANAALLVCFWL